MTQFRLHLRLLEIRVLLFIKYNFDLKPNLSFIFELTHFKI